MSDADEWVNDIHQGDAEETLREMPESSVHSVVTSPPYFGLRDYGVDGQIGLEDSLDQYVDTLVNVGRAVRHVLRDDGSWWLNLGDSYAGTGTGQPEGSHKESVSAPEPKGETLGRKNKMLVPYRVAIALQRDGRVVRNDATWHKPNAMPQSVKDRLNTCTEQVFHLVPEPDYWYDLDAIRESYAEDTLRESKYNWQDESGKTGKAERESGGVQNVGGAGTQKRVFSQVAFTSRGQQLLDDAQDRDRDDDRDSNSSNNHRDGGSLGDY